MQRATRTFFSATMVCFFVTSVVSLQGEHSKGEMDHTGDFSHVQCLQKQVPEEDSGTP